MLGRNLWLAVCGLVLFAPVARAGEPAAGSTRPGPSPEELRGWVQQLDADEYDVREEAAGKLTAAGAAAIEALALGMTSDQAEVAWRCAAALEQIGLEGDEKTIDQIVKQLDAAAAKSGKKLNSLARDLHARQKQFRRNRAIAQIRKNGGQIAGVGIDGGIEEMGMAPMIGPVMVFDGPAIAIAEPVEAIAIPEPLPEMEAPAPLGIFGGLAKAIARALVPVAGRPEPDVADLHVPPEPKIKLLDLPYAPDEPAGDEKPAAVKPAEEKPREDKPAEEKPAEALPAPAVPESEPAPAAEAAAEAGDVAVAEVAFAEAMIAVDFGAVGPGGMEAGGWAQLALDQNWRGGDDGLSVLADVPDVTQIDIRGAKLTDKALDHLAHLPRLTMVNLRQSPFTRDGLLKFHRRKPSVQVYARGEAMLGVNADLGSSPLLLNMVYDGSSASDVGLQVGDVVHEIDGVKIRDFSELTICISTKKPGDKIDIVYERGGQKHTVAVTLKRRTIDD
jgi:hypothetical protein